MAYENRLRLSENDLQDWIALHYGLDVSIGMIRSGYMSTVVWLKTHSEQFVFKVYGEEVFKQITYGMDVTDHLRENGLPVVACIPSLHGDFLVDLFGQKAALWSCLPGDVFTPGNQVQIWAAGKMLGQFHRVTHSVSKNSANRLTVERIVEELQVTWDLVVDKEGRAIVEIFRDYLAEVTVVARDGWSETIVHCDYRAQNLLFASNNVSGILDLDGSCLGPRIFDVVYALAFFQAVIADGPLSESEMVGFLKAYHSEAELTSAELDDLSMWLSLALLKGMTLWLRIGYVENVHDNAKVWIDAYRHFLSQSKPIAKRLVFALRGNG